VNIEEAQKELRDLRTTDNARRIASKIEQYEIEADQMANAVMEARKEIARLKALDPRNEADMKGVDPGAYHGGGRDMRSGYDKFFGTNKRND